ncbi:MAG: hypothetical protein ACYC56_10540 [Candidatus Aquicultor sp.]
MGWDVYNQVFANVGNQIGETIRKRQQAEVLAGILGKVNEAQKNFGEIDKATNTTTEQKANPMYKAENAVPNVVGSIGLGQGQPVQESDVAPISFNPASQNNFIQQNSMRSTNPTPALSNILASAPRGMNTISPEAMYKEDVTGSKTYEQKNVTPISDMEKYNRKQDIINNILVNALSNPDMDQEGLARLNTMAGILQGDANRDLPKNTYQTIRDGEIAITRDKYGKEISREENKKDYPDKDFRMAGKPYYENGMVAVPYFDRNNNLVDTKYHNLPKGAKGSTDNSSSDTSKIDEVDYSSDWGNVVQGIQTISRLKEKQPLKEGIHKGKYEFESSNGDKSYLTQKELDDYKEQGKKPYTKSALDMVKKYDLKTQRNLNDFIDRMRKYRDANKADWRVAYDAMKKANPDITKEEEDLIRKYFEIQTL